MIWGQTVNCDAESVPLLIVSPSLDAHAPPQQWLGAGGSGVTGTPTTRFSGGTGIRADNQALHNYHPDGTTFHSRFARLALGGRRRT